MKNTLKNWVLLGISFLSSTCSARDYEYDVLVPNIPSGFEISGGVLFLRPSAGNLGWTTVTDCQPFMPNWEIKTLKPDYQTAFTLGLHYFLPCSGTDLQLNWIHFRSHDSEAVQDELTEAHGNVKFHFDVVNFDIGTYVNLGPNAQLRLFTGITGAHIEERLHSLFKSPDPFPSISVDNTSCFGGIGPRLGFACSYNLCGDFSFIGQSAGSLLFGKLRPGECSSSNKEKISCERVYQTVPALEAKLGLTYIYKLSGCYPLILEAGYMGAIYFDSLSSYESCTNTLPLELGSLSTNSMKRIESNFSVNGPYFLMTLKF